MEKRQPFQQLLGKLNLYLQKTETRSMSFTLYTYSLKVNIRPEILKIGQERAENTLEEIGIGNTS
jgi:hypothetical protein